MIMSVFNNSLSESLPDCRGVFEGTQYKPLIIIDVCIRTNYNATLMSTIYKCDDINNYVTKATYNGDNCDGEIISTEATGYIKSNEFVNCESSTICDHAITKSFINDDCSKDSDNWYEKLYAVNWCHSYIQGTSTLITCDSQYIRSTTIINYEQQTDNEQIANCDIGSVINDVIIVENGQCQYDDDYDVIQQYPFYTQIEKCYNSQSDVKPFIISIIFTICLSLFIFF